jgi:hypothetical protein
MQNWIVLFLLFLPHANALQAPPFLYHWTTLEKLQHWNQLIDQHQKLTFNPVPENMINVFAHQVDQTLHQHLEKDLHSIPKVFAFETPVGAMGFGDELYANSDSPVLVTLQISATAKVFGIDTGWQKTAGDFNTADLIYHGTDHISEWIILNPNAVMAYSAHPKNLATILAHYQDLLKTENTERLRQLPLIHSDQEKNLVISNPALALQILNRYLSLDTPQLPSQFRSELQIKSPPEVSASCELYLTGNPTNLKNRDKPPYFNLTR